MFLSASSSLSSYLMNKIIIKTNVLAEIVQAYILAFKKIKKGRDPLVEAVKTIWVIFERVEIDGNFADEFYWMDK